MAQYPSFIFADQVPAQQMVEHARSINEGLRIQELGKARQAEGLFRMAQLQQQAKAQQEKNALDRMLAEAQMEQNRIAQEFQGRQLQSQEKIAGERNKNYLEGLRIQYPNGAVPPQLAATQAKLEYDAQLERKAESQDNALIQEWQLLDEDISKSQTALDKPLPGRGFLTLSRGDYNARLKEDEKTKAEVARKRQRQQMIEAILAQRGKVPTSRRGAQAGQVPPPAGSMNMAPSVGQPAELSPFYRQLYGLQPGQSVVQDGVTYTIK